VYEFFATLVENKIFESQANDLWGNISNSFIQGLMELLESDNDEERDYIRKILHQLYSRAPSKKRETIKSFMNERFYNLIYNTYQFNGAPQLLELMASIINGYKDLNNERVEFFEKILIPLYKVQTSSLYSKQLSTCIDIYIRKLDPKLTTKVNIDLISLILL